MLLSYQFSQLLLINWKIERIENKESDQLK